MGLWKQVWDLAVFPLVHHHGPDPEMVKVLNDFNEDRRQAMATLLAKHRGEDSLLGALTEEVDCLRQQRRELELVILREGMNLPPSSNC